MAQLISGPCDGAEIEDDSVSTYVIPWNSRQPDAIYTLNPSTGHYHFVGYDESTGDQ